MMMTPFEAIDKELNDLQRTIDELEHENRSLEDELDSSQSHIAQLEDEVYSLEEQVKKLQNDIHIKYATWNRKYEDPTDDPAIQELYNHGDVVIIAVNESDFIQFIMERT